MSSRTRAKSQDLDEEKTVPAVKPKLPAQPLNFQRIDEDKYKHIVATSANQSFFTKAMNGEGDKFGEWSNDRLFDKRGKGFKKEKGKMKNRCFHSAGQRIGTCVNSIKL